VYNAMKLAGIIYSHSFTTTMPDNITIIRLNWSPTSLRCAHWSHLHSAAYANLDNEVLLFMV